VWGWGDRIQHGDGLAWGVPMPTPKQMWVLGEPFRPYRSVAAWYRWRAVETYAGAAESAVTG
jgi:DNA-3-methyladenine glycosylase II